jgi:hypothetical protein
MRETVAWARELLGGNGIVLDYNVARFFADAEALYSYEGAREMQNLIDPPLPVPSSRLWSCDVQSSPRIPTRAKSRF